MEGGGKEQTPTHFIQCLLIASVPLHPLPLHTRTPIPVAESEFGPNGREADRLTKTLILVGTVIIFQRHRMEHQPFADNCQLHQSSNPSATDQTLLSVQDCIYDTKDWMTGCQL